MGIRKSLSQHEPAIPPASRLIQTPVTNPKNLQKKSRAVALAVDYLIGSTVVEIAMNLRDQNNTFERSILKALMLIQGEIYRVTHLLFLAKIGARARCNTPSCKAVLEWAEREYGLIVEVRELGTGAECILDSEDR